ncbi:DUF7226 domain-containing protein [Lysinibacillus fusiformis]|uniref:DUF7226 domain-containing protein n=1 Tax=Lysinibacillus fusiformis TaxID=28031 RepID=UPI003D092D2C
MLISRDVPQADTLSDVIRTVQSVGNGATTFQEIALAIGKGERQGRYYRLAAEQLGMIESMGSNHSQINNRGREFLSLTNDEQRRVYLANAVLHNPACHSVYDFIYNNPSCERDAITQHLINEGLSDSLANRRDATIITWLIELNLINETNNTYRVLWRPAFNDNVQVIENLSVNNEEGTTYQANDLSAFEDIWDGSYTGNDDEISFTVDRASRERASISHQNLVRTMALKLNHKHITPMMNRHIDLYASINNQMHIFEMKSCNQDNIISQIRKGISQLYEYRYRYNFSGAELWLVLEEQPINNNSWSIDYLVIDRRINVCWLSDNGEFDCPESCIDELNELLE